MRLLIAAAFLCVSLVRPGNSQCSTWGAWNAGTWSCNNATYKFFGAYFEELIQTRQCSNGTISLETRKYDAILATDNGLCNTGCSSWTQSSNYYAPPVCAQSSLGIYKEQEKEIYNKTRSGFPCYTTYEEVETGNSRWGGDCWSEWSPCSHTCGKGVRGRYFGSPLNNITTDNCTVINCILFPTGCDAEVDIGFIVDTSTSIGSTNFPLVKEFIVTLLEALRPGIDSGRAKVSLLRYSSFSTITQEFNFNDYSRTDDIMNGVYKMAFPGGQTYTGLALNYMFDNGFAISNGYRQNVPNMVFVITDGKSFDSVEGPAQRFKDNSSTVYVVGVTGGVDMNQLNAIASDPDASHVFLAATFTDLANITTSVMTEVCSTAPTIPTTAPTTAAPAGFPLAAAIVIPAALLAIVAFVITGCCCAKGLLFKRRKKDGETDEDDDVNYARPGSGSQNQVAPSPTVTAAALQGINSAYPPSDTKMVIR